ncbi:hypothetical protein, partial [Acetobacter okinawensis]|uniref:hypothetical protein n=1 Tax=Acetobacter okinawensis TaxID=1076594 RepID=UPI001BADEEEB
TLRLGLGAQEGTEQGARYMVPASQTLLVVGFCCKAAATAQAPLEACVHKFFRRSQGVQNYNN